jgi:YegS/Rv2252/BmrU family lipid kinase
MASSKAEKWIFILNPTSGGGSGRDLLPELQSRIEKLEFITELIQTEYHGHASEIASKYLEKGFTHFIAVGGDGTMNEVAEPLVGNTGVTLGLIPAGTGNDFIQILGFPDRFGEEHWEQFFQQQTILMDAGEVNGRHFLNGMGLGFDAQVAAENYVAPGEVARGSGKSKYIWHILKTLLFYKEKAVLIESGDSSTESDCFINTIAVGRRFAGSFFLTPQAMANDGLLDVCMIKKLNLIQRLKILSMVPRGSHVSDPKVNYYQTDKLRISFKEKVPYHVDGELFFDTNFEVSINPSAVNIIFNPGGEHYFQKKS